MRLLRTLKDYLCPLSAVLINCSDFSKEDTSAMPKPLGLQPQRWFDPITEQQHYPPGFLLKLSTQKQTNSPAKRQRLALSRLASLGGLTWVPERAQAPTEAFPTLRASIKRQGRVDSPLSNRG